MPLNPVAALGLLGRQAPRGLLAPVPAPPAPAQPRPRDRVSGWRILDRVLGGQTVTEGLDAERARLQAEADRPLMDAQRSQILASITDPRERALFLASPDDWAKNVGQQFAPQVIAPGAGQAIGGRLALEMPRTVESGDEVLRVGTQGVEPIYTRTAPSIAETTARLAATRPLELSPGARAIDPATGTEIARGADRVFSAADAAQLFTEDGRLLAQNARDAGPIDPADAERTRRALESQRQQISSVRNAIGRARDQIGFWTTGPLAGLSNIGGTPAADLAATLDTIEANLSFQALNEMRANSPTGGALGSITERELQLLGATVASLRQSQSPDQLRQNLQTIERTLADIERRSTANAAGGGGGVRSVQTPAEAQALPPGTRYRTPDGREFIR